MARRQNDPEKQLSASPSLSSLFSTSPPSRVSNKTRRLSVLALPAVLLLFAASAGGLAVFVVATLYPLLRVDGDLASRALVFAASVMGLASAALHLAGCRTGYVRADKSGPPQIHGNHLHAVALMLGRFELPVWVVAAVLTSLLVAKTGVVLAGGLEGKSPFISMLVCAVGLPSLCVLLFIHEVSETPFATALLSRNPREWQEDTSFDDDLSVSRRGSVVGVEEAPRGVSFGRASQLPQRSPTIVNGHEVEIKMPAEDTFSSTPEPLRPFGSQTPEPGDTTGGGSSGSLAYASQPRPSQLYHLPTRFSGQRRVSRGSIVVSNPPLPAVARALKRASRRLSRGPDIADTDEDEDSSTLADDRQEMRLSRTARRVQKERQRARSMSVNFSRPLRRTADHPAVLVRSRSEAIRPANYRDSAQTP